MTIQFKCPACQAPLRAPEEMAGRRAKCRQCGGAVSIPSPEADRWPPGMAPPSAAPAPTPSQSAPRPAAKAAPSAPARPAAPKPAKAAAPQKKPAQPALPTTAPAAPVAQAVPVQPANAAPTAVPQAMPIAPASGTPPQAAPPAISPLSGSDVPQAQPLDALDDLTPHDAFDAPAPLDGLAEMLDLELNAPRAPSAAAPQANPYSAPAAVDRPAERSDKKRIAYGETMSTTWRIFTSNLGPLLGATIATALAWVAINGAVFGILMAFGLYVIQPYNLASPTLANIIMVLWALIVAATFTFLLLGYTKFVVQIARGKAVDFSHLVGAADLVVPGMVLLIGTFLAVLVGALLFLLPGIIIGLLLGLAPIALVDKEEGLMPAINTSFKVVSQNLLPVFLLLFSVGLLGNVLNLVTLGFGVLVIIPFQLLLGSVIYLRGSGRRTAID